MITKEIFEYFQKIHVSTDQHIPHELFLPIRHKISFAAATNYSHEDKDGATFWKTYATYNPCPTLSDLPQEHSVTL
ncbi:MAG: hypothetical protein I8H80_00075 [Alphaproteobacteria bacterium]|nr:hypothetical protein [Alphaproteobacteria bacterium]